MERRKAKIVEYFCWGRSVCLCLLKSGYLSRKGLLSIMFYSAIILLSHIFTQRTNTVTSHSAPQSVLYLTSHIYIVK